MSGCMKQNNLETHQRLVQLIEEEAILINNSDGAQKHRHQLILGFLIQLQIISSKEL